MDEPHEFSHTRLADNSIEYCVMKMNDETCNESTTKIKMQLSKNISI